MALIKSLDKTDLRSLKYGRDRFDGDSSKQPFIQVPIPGGTSTLIKSLDKTDLRSLKYGRDRFDGDSSKQPFIQVPIPGGTSTLGGALAHDFILRGGPRAITDAGIDVLRLSKYFKTTSGVLFTAKQNLLSRTAVPAQGGTPQAPKLFNEGSYTPLSTLAQAGVVALGTHLNKQGNPFADTGVFSTNPNLYFNKVVESNKAEKNTFFLSDIFTPTTGDDTSGIINFGTINNLQQGKGTTSTTLSGEFANRLTNLWYTRQYLNEDIVDILSYSGGPGSTLGIGKTNIKFARGNSSGQDVRTNQVLVNTRLFPQNTNVLDFKQTAEQTSNNTRPSSPILQDFRKKLRNQINVTKAPDYDTNNIESRVNIGGTTTKQGPGYAAEKNLVSYTKGSGIGPIDNINFLLPYTSSSAHITPATNDLVQFRIALIDNNTPTFKTFIHFRAFLDSMADSYNATWNPDQYLGRSENFYNYGGFTRTISLSWTVAAQSKEELIPMYKKLNLLASSLAGDYSTSGYMRGMLSQLTVGGYLYEQPGIITQLTYDIPQESPWEIGINDEGITDNSVREMPHIIRVTGFSFTPIYRKKPQFGAPFISLENSNGTLYNNSSDIVSAKQRFSTSSTL
jgi:hypothetical protein